MIFCSTCATTQRLTLVLRDLGFDAICLHGQMSQPKRIGALSKFTAQKCNIIVATDVASRGLDIPHVDCVLNYDIPMHSKDYIHRVGRTFWPPVSIPRHVLSLSFLHNRQPLPLYPLNRLQVRMQFFFCLFGCAWRR